MNIFNLRKKRVVEAEASATLELNSTMEEMTTETITPVVAFALLVEYAKEMANQSKETAAVEEIPIENVRKEYTQLVTLGLGNTQNARVLKEKLDETNAYNERIQKARCIMEYIKRVNKIFGGSSFLVSKEKFMELCERNGLSIGLLADYIGVIPSRNIEEIANARKGFLELYPKDEDSEWELSRLSHRLFVKRIHLEWKEDQEKDAEYIREVKAYLKEIDNMLIAKSGYRIDGGLIRCSARNVYPKLPFSRISHIDGAALDEYTFFIACPPKYVDNTEVQVSKEPIDPIVFQYCPYGVLVHSVWGEEAEDAVLKEYMKLNDLL